MDSENLSTSLLKAGQEYLESMQRLRLNPEGLLWARMNEIRSIKINENGELKDGFGDYPGDWHLVLITSLIDEAGPSALNELLVKAYDASATPKEISPFIVEVMSAKSPFVARLLSTLNSPIGPISISGTNADGETFIQNSDPLGAQTMIGGLWFDRKWIYLLSGLHSRHAERAKQWRLFRQSVNALAA